MAELIPIRLYCIHRYIYSILIKVSIKNLINQIQSKNYYKKTCLFFLHFFFFYISVSILLQSEEHPVY